ncbi:MAG: hypothetical protein AAF514_20935, partial [Verrucomicrobiota bacterium]
TNRLDQSGPSLSSNWLREWSLEIRRSDENRLNHLSENVFCHWPWTAEFLVSLLVNSRRSELADDLNWKTGPSETGLLTEESVASLATWLLAWLQGSPPDKPPLFEGALGEAFTAAFDREQVFASLLKKDEYQRTLLRGQTMTALLQTIAEKNFGHAMTVAIKTGNRSWIRSRWKEGDRETTIRWLEDQPFGSDRSQWATDFFQAFSSGDPEGALAEVDRFRKLGIRVEPENSALRGLVQKDLRKAIAWVAADPDRSFDRIFYPNQNMTPGHGEEAWKLLDQVRPKDRDSVISMILSGIATTDVERAIALYDQVREDSEASPLPIALQLAAKDFGQAVQWIKTLGNEKLQHEALESVLRDGQNTPHPAEIWNSIEPHLEPDTDESLWRGFTDGLLKAHRRDPGFLFDQGILGRLAGQGMVHTLKGLVNYHNDELITSHPKAIATLIENHPEIAPDPNWVDRVVRAWAPHEPVAAREWVESLEDDSQRAIGRQAMIGWE